MADIASLFNKAHIENLYNDLRRANTEQAKKERFLQYLTKAFAKDEGAQSLISAMTMGAERVVANITRGGRLARGRADSQTDTVIIEWEKDLTKTGEHAREQLEEYLEGNWRSGETYRYVLIATDGIRWRRYAPDWSEVEIGKLRFGRDFKLREVRRFELAPDRFADFPFFLDELLFAGRPRAATLESIQTDFGDTSRAFINSIACLQGCARDLESKSELKVAFEQWQRFLSVAYGRFDDSTTMFLVHTYLSVFAKFIAYAVTTKKSIVDEKTMHDVLTGAAFEEMNIERFVEDDFFHWVAAEGYFRALQPMFRELNRQLGLYDLSEVKEDILKGVYQELIDLETRHALGEYYTPDWLCERIIAGLSINERSSFLDPACGSGSFLRAGVAAIRAQFPHRGAAAIAEQVVGIDIHPLSVLIAKTTMLLALGSSVTEAKSPVVLHIYLANSLLVPRGTADLFESTFQISVDNKNYVVDVAGLNGADDFDDLISFCDEIVDRYEDQLDRDRFVRLLGARLKGKGSASLPNQLYDVYRGMQIAHAQGRDSIWKFILQNSYKPVFLMNRFDFVVGNPPWLTYAGVSNGEYQSLLRQLSNSYDVTPFAQKNMPHLEIAAIFLAHAVNYFLKPDGKLTFVMPRSFISADQHENTRQGLVKGLKLTSIWDLAGVQPLFRVPSCVLSAVRAETGRAIPVSGISGTALSGQLPRSQMHWAEAAPRLKEEPRRWYYSRLQSGKGIARSALTNKAVEGLTGTNAYASRFTQGATIVPRNFFFVDVNQTAKDSESLHDRVVSVRTAIAAEREAKAPWKGELLSNRAEGSLLFRTAVSRNIIPFALVDPPLVLLPVTIEESADGNRVFQVHTADELLERDLRYGSRWFLDAETCWNSKKTDSNREKSITLGKYLNWQNKLTGQNPDARYIVLYTSSATDASATLVDRQKFDHPFVVDHKAYWCECTSEAEGHYLSAYINSGFANDTIKEFQSRGLFGPRDIHKLIVKLPFPRFQKSNQDHARLAELGKSCAKLVGNYVKRVDVTDLQARALGRVRSQLRIELASNLKDIDALVEKLSGVSASSAVQRRGKKRARTGRLFD